MEGCTYKGFPNCLKKTDDMANTWRSWKDDFIIFMKLNGIINKPNKICASFLKNLIGEVGLDAIQSISFDKPQDKDNIDILIAKLDEFFNSPKNEVAERYQFFIRDKKRNETIEQYINVLREKAKTCNFKEPIDDIIRDRIIFITQDQKLLKAFHEIKNLDLQTMVAIYNDYNETKTRKQVTRENKLSINERKKVFWSFHFFYTKQKCYYDDNKANFPTKDMGPMNKEISSPRVSCDTASSTCSNNTFNSFKVLRGLRKSNSNLCSNNTTNRWAARYFSNSTQYNIAYMRRGKPIMKTTDDFFTPYDPSKEIVDKVIQRCKEIRNIDQLMKKLL